MHKPVVIHLLSSGNYSGAEKIATKIIEATTKEVQSYYLSPSGIINDILIKKKINHIVWPKMSIFALMKYIRATNASIIHAHDFRTSVLASLCPSKIKIISHLHQNPPWLYYINPLSVLYYLLSIRFLKIIFVSNWMSNNSLIFNLIKRKSITIENYVDTQEIIDKSKSNSAKIPQFDIIYLGRLSEEKNPLMFLRIVKKLKKLKSPILVALVGDGPLYLDCTEFVKYNDLDKIVTFYGFQMNPYPILNNSKIIVIPSKWEGFGLVAVEATILGVRIVASRIGGLINTVSTKCGVLCESEDDFVENILQFLSNEKYSMKYDRTICLSDISIYTDIDKWKEQFLSIWEINN